MKKQNRIVRPIALVVAILWTFFLLTGCSSQAGGTGESQVGTTVTVRIVSQEATILDQQVTLTNDLTAGRAVKDACQNQKMAYTEQDGICLLYTSCGNGSLAQDHSFCINIIVDGSKTVLHMDL